MPYIEIQELAAERDSGELWGRCFSQCSIESLAFALARLTRTIAMRVDVGVFGIVGMALRAMGNSGIPRLKRVAAQQVLTACDWFKVPGVHTGGVPAQMVEVKSCRDWASQGFIGESVSAERLSRRNRELAITERLAMAHPQPALVHIEYGHLRPEPFIDISQGSASLVLHGNVAVDSQSFCMHRAKTFALDGLGTFFNRTVHPQKYTIQRDDSPCHI